MDTASIRSEQGETQWTEQTPQGPNIDRPAVTIILFLLPTAFFLALFILWPIYSTFRLSLFEWNGIDPQQTWVGLENWIRLLQDGIFYKAFRNNLIIVGLSIALQLPIAMLLAVMLDYSGRNFIGRVLKTIYFLPLLMSSVAIGILFKFIYDPSFGALTVTLRQMGLDGLVRNWLADPQIAIYSVVAVICWQFVPFYMILFLAALTSIPGEMRDAAVIDGATQRQFYTRVAIPMIRGTVRTAVVLSFIGALKYFDLIWVMTGGGPFNSTELMATYMYKKAFVSADMGYGAAVAGALFIVVMGLSSVLFYSTRRFETEV